MRYCFYIIFLLSLLSWSPQLQAAQEPNEELIKAAYLFNIAKFINWPKSAFSDPNSAFVIGVLGEKKITEHLQPLLTKTVNKRPINIKIYKSIHDVSGCHILYLGTSKTESQADLTALKSRPIVTVGEDKNFAATEGIIQFIPVRGRLRFIINLANADAAGVRIDSQLLSLAIDVLGVKK